MEQFSNLEEAAHTEVCKRDKKNTDKKNHGSLLTTMIKKPLSKCTFLLVLLIGCCELLSMIINKLYPSTLNSAIDVLTGKINSTVN